MSLTVVPVTPEIAALSQKEFLFIKIPSDRLIASTAMANKAPLISADSKLLNIESLEVVW